MESNWVMRASSHLTEGVGKGEGETPVRDFPYRRTLTQAAPTLKAPLKAAAVPRYGIPRAKSLNPKNGKEVDNTPSEPPKLSAAEKKRSMTVGAEMSTGQKFLAVSNDLNATSGSKPTRVAPFKSRYEKALENRTSGKKRIRANKVSLPADPEAEDTDPPVLNPTETARARMAEQDAENQLFFDKLGSKDNGAQRRQSFDSHAPPITPSSLATSPTPALRRPSYPPIAAFRPSSPRSPIGFTLPSSRRGPLRKAPPRSHPLDSRHPLAHNYYEIDAYYRQEAYDASQAEMEELRRERQLEGQERSEELDKLMWENTELRGRLMDRDREQKEKDIKKEAEFEQERKKMRKENEDLALGNAEKSIDREEYRELEGKLKEAEERERITDGKNVRLRAKVADMLEACTCATGL